MLEKLLIQQSIIDWVTMRAHEVRERGPSRSKAEFNVDRIRICRGTGDAEAGKTAGRAKA
jgi:hypothetical protein